MDWIMLGSRGMYMVAIWKRTPRVPTVTDCSQVVTGPFNSWKDEEETYEARRGVDRLSLQGPFINARWTILRMPPNKLLY
ncbi:hypothetical protein M404DRAFT_1007228 [Pisolithus tinctorius Marx 270]|uniref:Uncharacterized protein n=1 Tax=Pisolithus tinctorius Marx 270 TaxID=870435 RepID=A0A0C3N3V0_PISTI|nr:hypothetical protein M404DRAFT_1007228 [Pisolithus tinctorius Marx 270]